jgi:acetoin utilization protein AcuC
MYGCLQLEALYPRFLQIRSYVRVSSIYEAMSGRTALIYHEAYDGRGFAPMSDAWRRYHLAFQLISDLGLLDNGVELRWQEPASEAELALVHTDVHIAHVRQMDQAGTGYVDYGDTPAYPGIYRRACLSVGGSLLGARSIARGEVDHVFNPGGGLHHAHADRAGGFCVFNDIVIAVRALQREFGIRRIAIIDIDGHHGDGTQALLYHEPVLTVSLHQYDGRFFPRTGNLDEMGEGDGFGYAVNLPLPRHTGDRVYLAAFDAVVVPLVEAYRPEILLLQFGTDGHVHDPLVDLHLTTQTYQGVARRAHDLAHRLCQGRLLAFGGGGYDPPTVARCWTILLVELSGAVPESAAARYQALFDPEPLAEEPEVVAQVRDVVARVQAQLFPLHGLPVPADGAGLLFD